MRKEGLRMTHYNIRSALHIASLFVHTLTHSSNGIWWDLNGLWQTEGSQSHCVVWMMMNFSVNSSRSRFYLSSCSWNALQYSPIWVCNSAVVCLLVLYSLWILSLLRWMDGWMKELTEWFVVGISSKYIHIATRFLLNDTTRKRQNRIHYIMYEANINNKCAFLHHNGERKGHHCRPIVNVGVSSMNWMGHVNIAVYILSLFSIFRRLIPGGGVDGRAGVGHYYYYLLHLEGLGIGQQRVTFLEFCSVS